MVVAQISSIAAVRTGGVLDAKLREFASATTLGLRLAVAIDLRNRFVFPGYNCLDKINVQLQ